jgi:hypothetical protein
MIAGGRVPVNPFDPPNPSIPGSLPIRTLTLGQVSEGMGKGTPGKPAMITTWRTLSPSIFLILVWFTIAMCIQIQIEIYLA